MPELTLEYVVRGRSDSAGAKDAKAAMEDMASSADKVAASTRNASSAQDAFAVKQDVSKREVRYLTAELLHSIGITHEAGSAGRVAAEGFEALGNSANLANFMMAGAGLAVVALVPLIREWMGENDKAKQKIDEVVRALLQDRSLLNDITTTYPGASKAVREYADALNTLSRIENEREVKKMEKDLDDLKDKMLANNAAVQGAIPAWRQIAAEVVGADFATRGLSEQQEAARDDAHRMAAEIDALTAKIAIYKKALEKGEGGQDFLEGMKKQGEESKRHLEEDAAFRKKFAQDQDTQALVDMAQFGEKKHAADVKANAEEAKLNEVRFAAERKNSREAAAENVRNVEHEFEMEQEERRADLEAQAKYAEEAAGIARALFGKSKMGRIAEALAHTYAGAARAFADYPWPVDVAVAAMVTVQGLAQVANIEKTNAGFDSPANDAIAESFGRRWARDLVQKIDFGVMQEIHRVPVGGSVTTHNVINRGTTIHSLSMGMMYPEPEQVALTRLNRKLNEISRFEDRATHSGGRP